MKVKALIVSLTLAIGGAAFAQTATPNLDKREAKQQARIDQGGLRPAHTQGSRPSGKA